MTLRLKTLVAGMVALLGLLVLVYVTSRAILLDSYIQLEEREARDHALRAANVLQEDIDDLGVITHDWASWDDAYAYMQTRNPAFVGSNMVDGTYADNDLDVIVLLTQDAQIVYGRAFDEAQEIQVDLPAGLVPHLAPGKPLLSPAAASQSKSGVLRLPEGMLLVAAYPIRTSNDEGPARGVLVMGRFLDAKKITDLARITRLSLTIHPLGQRTLPPDFQHSAMRLKDGVDFVLQTLDNDRVAGYVLMKDIAGMPGLILRADVPRDIYEQGQRTLMYLVAALTLAGLLAGGLFMVLLEWLVLARLARLDQQLDALRTEGDPGARLPVERRDEIGELGREINDLLDALEDSHVQLRSQERQRQAASLLDSLPAYAYMKNVTGRYLAVNQQFCHLVSRSAGEILGQTDDKLFLPEVAQQYREREMAVLGSGEPQSWEEHLADNGVTRYVISRIVPFRDEFGKMAGIIGVKFEYQPAPD